MKNLQILLLTLISRTILSSLMTLSKIRKILEEGSPKNKMKTSKLISTTMRLKMDSMATETFMKRGI